MNHLTTIEQDEHFMKQAIRQAQHAWDSGEVPVGCVIVHRGSIIARGYNFTEHLKDFTAHAEMQAFTAASECLSGKYLDECTLYVTLEPCVMCAGAAYNTRIGRIVFGAYDQKRGYTRFGGHEENGQGLIHPRTEVRGGVLGDECAAMLTAFFRQKREKQDE